VGIEDVYQNCKDDNVAPAVVHPRHGGGIVSCILLMFSMRLACCGLEYTTIGIVPPENVRSQLGENLHSQLVTTII
jgi:hypothetical protein